MSEEPWISPKELSGVVKENIISVQVALGRSCEMRTARSHGHGAGAYNEYNPRNVQELLDDGTLTLREDSAVGRFVAKPSDFLAKYKLKRPAPKEE